MAGHDDSGSSEKKSSEAMNDAPTFNAENMQNNMKSVYYSRTFMSIIGGVIAGILGFTSLTGFIFFSLVMAITSVGLIAKAGFSIHSFFDSWTQIILDGILGGLMSFVLFWTSYSCSNELLLWIHDVLLSKSSEICAILQNSNGRTGCTRST